MRDERDVIPPEGVNQMSNRASARPPGCPRRTPMPAKILQFLSRAEQLRVRGSRNYDSYMRLTKGLVAPDGPERLGWQRQSSEESVRDSEWQRRHGTKPGGAVILAFVGATSIAKDDSSALDAAESNSC
jgi:hypothetical protein